MKTRAEVGILKIALDGLFLVKIAKCSSMQKSCDFFLIVDICPVLNVAKQRTIFDFIFVTSPLKFFKVQYCIVHISKRYTNSL